MPTIELKYFALFRERAGCEGERLSTPATTIADLYAELSPRLGLPPAMVRAAVNGEFVDMDRPLGEDDEIVFVPPVAGG